MAGIEPKIAIEPVLERVRHHPKMVIAEDYELVMQSGDMNSAKYENGECVSVSKESRVWLALRVLHRKRLGVASSVFCSLDEINTLVERAFEAAECTAVNPWFRFPLWRGVVKDEFEREGGLGEGATEKFIESQFSQLVQPPMGLEELYETSNFETFTIRKSEKATIRTRRILGAVHFTSLVQGQDEVCRLVESRRIAGERWILKAQWLDRLLRRSHRFQLAQSPRTPRQEMPGGPVVVDGSVVARVLGFLTAEFSGRRALSEQGLFFGKIEKPILPEGISLIDDGRLELGWGTGKFDMEGVPMQRTQVVEQGILKSFLHDTISGAQFNRTSTGNLLQTSFGSPAEIGPSNFYLVPSEKSLLNLIEQMGSGFYLESLASSHISFDVERRELSLLANGWLVSKGDPIQPICNVRVRVKPFEFFQSITDLANDLDFYERCGAPSVFIKNMPLSDVCG